MMVAIDIDANSKLLAELDLEPKHLKACEAAGLKTVGDVLEIVKKSRRALLKLPGIGKACADAILDTIEDAGFYIEAPALAPERTPDDDELADIVIDQVRGNFTFFRSAWHKYEKGYWRPTKGINHEIIAMLRANRYKGVRPSRSRASSVEFFVQAALELEDESVIDEYPQYINLQNGLFNLESLKLEPHRKDVYVTTHCDFPYEPKATAPNFRKFLGDVLTHRDGNPDWLLVNLVQEAIGYSLTADTSHRVSFWVKGPRGSGKSTLLNAIIGLLQHYHATINLNELATNRFMLSGIAGKRIATFGESESHVKLADGIYKMLVSKDPILADVKNRDPFSFIPQAKIWWAMNNFPFVSDRSGAVDSRVLIIPFWREIPREKWDLELDMKITGEKSGIFNFALEGLARLRRQGFFTRVPQVEMLGEEFRMTQDIYASFLADTDWIVPDGVIAPTLLYKAFCAWANENGLKNFASKIAISREWERLGLERGHDGNHRFYRPVSLTERARKLVFWE